ncbi:hypothetical protein TNCV_16891 [Trichonephila clavipes]|nr:hypothetical protein TNCV_16891 [Trichonephila clavipes]
MLNRSRLNASRLGSEDKEQKEAGSWVRKVFPSVPRAECRSTEDGHGMSMEPLPGLLAPEARFPESSGKSE